LLIKSRQFQENCSIAQSKKNEIQFRFKKTFNFKRLGCAGGRFLAGGGRGGGALAPYNRRAVIINWRTVMP